MLIACLHNNAASEAEHILEHPHPSAPLQNNFSSDCISHRDRERDENLINNLETTETESDENFINNLETTETEKEIVTQFPKTNSSYQGASVSSYSHCDDPPRSCSTSPKSHERRSSHVSKLSSTDSSSDSASELRSRDPFSEGRGSKRVISRALHCKFLMPSIVLGLLGQFCLVPASAAAQTNISCGQCVFNVSLAIPWTHLCSLPHYSLENDTLFASEHTSLVLYQSQLFYFLFGALFILLYLKWLHLEYNMPKADGMVDLTSPSEASSPPQASDLNYSLLVKRLPMLCYWVYENSEPSTSDSAVEELSVFIPSYHPLDPEQNGPSSVASKSEMGLFVINQNVRKAKQATNPAIMIVTEGSVGKPGSSINEDDSDKVNEPVSVATEFSEESIEDANNKILHSQEQEFMFLLDRNDVDIQPRKVTFDGNNSGSVCVVPKSNRRHDIEGNPVYLHNQHPRPRLVPSSAISKSPTSPKPRLPKIPTESGCGTVLQNGAKTLGCMVEPDITKDELELLPLCEEDSLSDPDNQEYQYSCYDLPHLELKPFVNQYGDMQ